MRADRTLLLLSLLLSGLWPGRAAALKYKPKDGETLSHVAVLFYGKPQKIVYLQAANNIDNPDRMPQDRELLIPTVLRYQMRRGDDLSKIAKRYLLSDDRSDFLIWLNEIKDPKNIKAGTLITIPFVLKHKATEGQSLTDVANRYYWSTKDLTQLRRFNDRRTNALKAGEIVLVPIFDPDAMTQAVEQRQKRFLEDEADEARRMREMTLRSREQPPGAEAAEGPAPPPETGTLPAAPEVAAAETHAPPSSEPPTPPSPKPSPTEVAASPMPAAPMAPPTPPSAEAETTSEDAALLKESLGQVHEGDFDLARAGLSRLLERSRLSRRDEIEARRALALCLVALEAYKEAEHEFVRLLMLSPELELKPSENSPKVLEVFRRAKSGK